MSTPEAVVAGEAAAAAVDEIQTRQALAEQTAAAEVAAEDAEYRAMDAESTAGMAAETAVVAAVTAEEALSEVGAVADGVEAAQDYARLAYDEAVAARAETARMGEALQQFFQTVQPPANGPQVEEVNVSDGAEHTATTDQEGSGGTGPGSAGQSDGGDSGRRRGLRFGR